MIEIGNKVNISVDTVIENDIEYKIIGLNDKDFEKQCDIEFTKYRIIMPGYFYTQDFQSNRVNIHMMKMV